jgi:hypothetical protein
MNYKEFQKNPLQSLKIHLLNVQKINKLKWSIVYVFN